MRNADPTLPRYGTDPVQATGRAVKCSHQGTTGAAIRIDFSQGCEENGPQLGPGRGTRTDFSSVRFPRLLAGIPDFSPAKLVSLQK